MTLTPARLPLPARAQRILRQPPDPGITSPTFGALAINTANSARSSSDQHSGQRLVNSGDSMTVSMGFILHWRRARNPVVALSWPPKAHGYKNSTAANYEYKKK